MFEKRTASPDEVDDVLSRLNDQLLPFRELCVASVGKGAWIDEESGAFLSGHAPEIGPEAFDICIFPTSPKADTLDPGDERLRPILSRFNGAFFLELSLYGLGDELSRGVRQPLSLERGSIWSAEYVGAGENEVMFSSQNVTQTGQVGYFMKPDGEIIGRSNGDDVPSRFLQSWNSIGSWAATVLSSERFGE